MKLTCSKEREFALFVLYLQQRLITVKGVLRNILFKLFTKCVKDLHCKVVFR